jgi:hypothetical protein
MSQPVPPPAPETPAPPRGPEETPPEGRGPGCWPVLIPLAMLATVFFFILGICAR